MPPTGSDGQNWNGQDFSCKICKVCGMMYAPGVREDEKLHELMHREVQQRKGLSHKSWKSEKILFNGGKGEVSYGSQGNRTI